MDLGWLNQSMSTASTGSLPKKTLLQCLRKLQHSWEAPCPDSEGHQCSKIHGDDPFSCWERFKSPSLIQTIPNPYWSHFQAVES